MPSELRLKIDFANSMPIKRWMGNVLAGVVLFGLSAAAQNVRDNPPLDIHFEIFSIRPENMATGVPMNTAPSPNGFNSRLSLRQAIVMAYGSDNYSSNWSSVEILKAPEWIDDIYDIRARVSNADLNAWQNQNRDHKLLRAALRAALEERCQLAIREQPSKADTFELAIGRHGPLLKAMTSDAD